MTQSRYLVTHVDKRGFFREVAKQSTLPDLPFRQMSHSRMYNNVSKAWHYHVNQTDIWYVVRGVLLAVTFDLSGYTLEEIKNLMIAPNPIVHENILGDDQDARILIIPPLWAHGCRVLQGPVDFVYLTTQEYDPNDEGRIDHSLINYDWNEYDIK